MQQNTPEQCLKNCEIPLFLKIRDQIRNHFDMWKMDKGGREEKKGFFHFLVIRR